MEEGEEEEEGEVVGNNREKKCVSGFMMD